MGCSTSSRRSDVSEGGTSNEVVPTLAVLIIEFEVNYDTRMSENPNCPEQFFEWVKYVAPVWKQDIHGLAQLIWLYKPGPRLCRQVCTFTTVGALNGFLESPLHEAMYGSYIKLSDPDNSNDEAAHEVLSNGLHKHLQDNFGLKQGEPNLPFIQLKSETTYEVLAGSERTMMQWPFTTAYKGDMLSSNWEGYVPSNEDVHRAWTLFIEYDVVPSGMIQTWDEAAYCREVAGIGSEMSSSNWDKRIDAEDPNHHAWPDQHDMTVLGKQAKNKHRQKERTVKVTATGLVSKMFLRNNNARQLQGKKDIDIANSNPRLLNFYIFTSAYNMRMYLNSNVFKRFNGSCKLFVRPYEMWNVLEGSEHTTSLLSYKAGFGKIDYLEQELLEIDPAQRTDRQGEQDKVVTETSTSEQVLESVQEGPLVKDEEEVVELEPTMSFQPELKTADLVDDISASRIITDN